MRGVIVTVLYWTLVQLVTSAELDPTGITLNRTGLTKPGICPRGALEGPEQNCSSQDPQCQIDDDCPSELKCCNVNCRNVCVYPSYTGCQQMQILLSQQQSALEPDQTHVPKCRDDGKFEDVQCSESSKKCWCVDDLGFELAGTRENSFDLVNCSAPRPCADVLCRMLCPYGFELDSDGCPLCRCRNPCMGISCPAGQECQLEEIPCAEDICPPLPTCKKPRSLDDLCPFGVPLSSPDNGNPFLCGVEPNKPQCPPNYLCDVIQGNDYGVCCPLDEKIGTCPTALPAGETCGNNCSSDMHCEGVSKCCFVEGCGQICAKPANSTLCLQQKAVVEILLSGNDRSEGYIPQCLDNGEFSPRQCSSNGYLCWCVTTNGTIITGTMGPKGTVDCGEPTEASIPQGRTQDDGNDFESFECEKLKCDPPCENGYKYDGKGCKTCECAEPCLDIACPEGMECILVKTENCFDDNCFPIATCRDTAVQCDWGKPLISNGTGVIVNCLNDVCPDTHGCVKKHNNGICCPKRIQIEHTKSTECPDFMYEPNYCDSACYSDRQCQGEYKCCPSKTCVALCVPPKPPRMPTMCEYVRDAGLNIIRPEGNATLAISVPQCLPDGPYSPTQCNSNGECWCVDEFGVEIINTRSSNSKMDCKKIRDDMSCLGLICRLGCDFGFVMDDQGCPLCSCRNPCQNASCGPQETCQFLEVDCKDDWCPPLPYCVPMATSARTLPVCAIGSPLMYEYSNEPVVCDPFSNYPQCPTTHDCTVENPRDMGVCCPRTVDISEEVQDNTPVEGQCPYLIPIQSESCEYICSIDAQCETGKKCCSNGCGTECVEPILKTACQHQKMAREHHARELGIPASHIFMPNCTESGDFEAVQCDPQDKACWCVDKSGSEIPGTREGTRDQITCFPNTEECSMLYCDLYCPHGYKMDRSGCPICECHDPCKDVRCKNPQEVCRLAYINCVTQPCPPLPLCLPKLENPCPIGAPLMDDYGEPVLCGPVGQTCPTTHRCHLSPLEEYATCCLKPPVISSCEQLKKRNQLLRKTTNQVTFLPKCNRKTGAWDPTQCMESLGLCWCVDAEGNQLPGTLIRGVPHCTARSGKSMENTPICDKGQPVHICPDTLCEGKVCLAYPNATCGVDPCGGCKIQFLDDFNTPVDCNNGLTACFAEVQGFINSGILKPKDVVDDDILPDLEETFGERNLLPPPAYPPPPPPPEFAKLQKRRSIYEYDDNQELLPFFQSSSSDPWYDDSDMQALPSEEQPYAMFTQSRPSTIQFEMQLPQMTPFIMPRFSSIIKPLPIQQISDLLSSDPHVQIFGISRRFTILDHGEPSQAVRAGDCPVPSLLSILLSISRGCTDSCADDYDCPDTYKCCLDTCGLSCTRVTVPFTIDPQAVASNEDCSLATTVFNPFTCLFANKLCFDDNDCKDNEKCCSTTCGTQCVKIAMKKAARNLKPLTLQAAAPRCSIEGGYAITQKQGELSWCVNQFGLPLHYTLTRGLVECDNNGTILSRIEKGPVCPDPKQTPMVCKDECLSAVCPLHPDATCVADPCDICSVKFMSPEGNVVPCEGICKQPLSVGNCRSFLPRFFFNQTSEKCEQFFYGGCQGNNNNFETMQQCQEECERPVPLCEQPREVGFCYAHISRWFYNKVTHQCEQFIYGGCNGNDNNFVTREECERTCPDLVLCPWINVNGEALLPCNRSAACADSECAGKSNVTCIVDPCSCKSSYVDRFGAPAVCSSKETEEELTASIRTAAIPTYTRCQSILRSHLLMSEMSYIPQCNEQGQFYPVQCSRDKEQRCWCVDEAGWQLPGSSGFTKGTKNCKFVKIKKVEVTLAFKHDDPAYAELLKPTIKSAVEKFLKQLKVDSAQVFVDVLPKKIHLMFTLLYDNKVQVAFQLEELMKTGSIVIVLPKTEMVVDEKSSHFYHEIDHDADIIDNGIASNRINDILISGSDYNWVLFSVLLTLGCFILFLVFCVIPAVIKRRKSKKEVVFDEKSKPSLVSLVFHNVRYGLGKKSTKKMEPQLETTKVVIKTVEAEFDSLQKKKIEGDEQSQCGSTISEGPPAYDDISEKDKSIENDKDVEKQ